MVTVIAFALSRMISGIKDAAVTHNPLSS